MTTPRTSTPLVEAGSRSTDPLQQDYGIPPTRHCPEGGRSRAGTAPACRARCRPFAPLMRSCREHQPSGSRATTFPSGCEFSKSREVGSPFGLGPIGPRDESQSARIPLISVRPASARSISRENARRESTTSSSSCSGICSPSPNGQMRPALSQSSALQGAFEGAAC